MGVRSVKPPLVTLYKGPGWILTSFNFLRDRKQDFNLCLSQLLTHFQQQLQLLRVRHFDGELHRLVVPRRTGPAGHGRLLLGGAQRDYGVGVYVAEGGVRLEDSFVVLNMANVMNVGHSIIFH